MKIRKKSNRQAAPHATGRPPKAAQDRRLDADAWQITQEFSLRPLRHPVDSQFAPYYEQILSGNLRSVAEYFGNNEANLCPSFLEFLGRLITIRFYPVADQILSSIECRGALGLPTDEEAYRYWEKTLLPLAQEAKKWICDYVANNSASWKRERAWLDYANAKALPDPPHLCDIERRRTVTHADQRPLYMSQYAKIGIVPRELFMLLAENRGSTRRPSHAVRRYLQDVPGLSYSKPSRKACAKK